MGVVWVEYVNGVLTGRALAAALQVDFANQFNIPQSSSQYGFMTSGMPIGACIGSLFAGVLQDKLGRRRSLILGCIGYICAVMISFTAGGFAQLAAGRVATGLCIGILSSTVPMYIAELSPPQARGRLVTLNQTCICLGVLLGYISCMFLTPDWRWVFAAGAPLAGLSLLMFVFVTPYSPRWLMSKGRVEEARRVLQQLRGSDIAADRELQDIKQMMDATASETMLERLRHPHVIWSIIIGVTMSFIQQWTGCNAVNAYAPDILSAAGFDSASSLVQSTYIGVSKLVMVVFALIVMDKFGRRQFLLWGTAGMAASLALFGAVLQVQQTHGSPPSGLGYVSEVLLFLYMGFFEVSLGPLLWLMLSELYPLSIRGVAMSIASTSCWLFTFSVTQTFPLLRGAITIYGVMYLFVGVCVVAVAWMYFFVPETRGKSLEQIEVMLKEGRTH